MNIRECPRTACPKGMETGRIWKVKLKAYGWFYRDTARRSLAVALPLAAFTALGSEDYLHDLLRLAAQCYPTIGLAADAGFRLLLRREEFYFYHNATCGTKELYAVSFLLSLLCSTPFLLLSEYL